MSAFLSERTRDWLTVGGTALAVLQTVLAIAAWRMPRGSSRAARAPRTGGLAHVVERLSTELGTTPRGMWTWILVIGPGLTLAVIGLMALAPVSHEAIPARIENDGGVVLGVAQMLQALQAFMVLLLALMLMTEAWGMNGDMGRDLPLALYLLVGAAGAVTLRLAMDAADWIYPQPVSLATRLVFSTSQSLIFPSLLCIGSVPLALIGRWMERMD